MTQQIETIDVAMAFKNEEFLMACLKNGTQQWSGAKIKTAPLVDKGDGFEFGKMITVTSEGWAFSIMMSCWEDGTRVDQMWVDNATAINS